jgi:hypothetical protein
VSTAGIKLFPSVSDIGDYCISATTRAKIFAGNNDAGDYRPVSLLLAIKLLDEYQ